MPKAHFVAETELSKQKALIVVETKGSFVLELKKELSRYDMDVYISPSISSNKSFRLRFIISSVYPTFHEDPSTKTKTIYIVFLKNRKEYHHLHTSHSQKVIHIIGDQPYAITQMEKILWFAVSDSSEARTLTLESFFPSVSEKKKAPLRIKKQYAFPKRTVITSLVLFCLMSLVAFFVPLTASTFFTYQIVKTVAKHDYQGAKKIIPKQNTMRKMAELLYSPVRPLYLFFSLAQFPDDILLINTTTENILGEVDKLATDGKQLAELITKPNKSEFEIKKARSLFSQSTAVLATIEDQLIILYRKVPSFLLNKKNNETFQTAIAELRKGRKAATLVPELLGDPTEKKILILFANNMELRPGGGFIGSFGVLQTKKFGIEKLTVYDVYDADGQLTAHVDPPTPIRQYLNQPHWFLRDSAFFPDFYDTYQQASFFLQKEMGFSHWDGCVLLTTSAVKDIVGSFGAITLPDYNEKITKDNFYIKTQFYAENNFFPGSTQKKGFLSAVVKQIFTELSSADPTLLGSAVIQAFDQKNIVTYLENTDMQKKIDDLYWNGKTAIPFCPASNQTNCYADYQYALDANVGVNKANFFVDRTYNVKTSISSQGLVLTTLEIHYKNNSLNAVFPGGTYRNYFQVLLPADALIQQITADDQPITQYDLETGKHRQIGFLLEIPPQAEKTVVIRYQSPVLLKKGRAIYQIVLQKQIGAQTSDLSFTLELPENIDLVNQNFSPLVKGSQIIYNTDLSTDRVFFIELLKE